MKVNFVDLKAQYATIKDEVNTAIAGVLESCAFINSRSFEGDFAKYIGTEYCVGVGNGTDALYMAMKGLGFGPGDEVITAANTFIATAEGIGRTGATPVFVDCDPVTYNIDPGKIEAAITDKTKAIVPVHLYGQPADMDAVMAIAKAHGLLVVEDCAQAHGATYKGRKVGTFGDAACFSFYPGKNLGAYGDGGAVCTNNEELAKHVRAAAGVSDHRPQFLYGKKVAAPDPLFLLVPLSPGTEIARFLYNEEEAASVAVDGGESPHLPLRRPPPGRPRPCPAKRTPITADERAFHIGRE